MALLFSSLLQNYLALTLQLFFVPQLSLFLVFFSPPIFHISNEARKKVRKERGKGIGERERETSKGKEEGGKGEGRGRGRVRMRGEKEGKGSMEMKEGEWPGKGGRREEG